VESSKNKKEEIPDPLLMEILDERLSKKDCELMGFILDGYPMNIA